MNSEVGHNLVIIFHNCIRMSCVVVGSFGGIYEANFYKLFLSKKWTENGRLCGQSVVVLSKIPFLMEKF